MPTPHHHIHQRKLNNSYPATTTFKKILDKWIYVVGIFGPMMTIPQIKTVRIDGITDGVSLWTRGGYIVFTCIWILYGIVHREKPIIFTQTLWCIVYSLVVIGVVIR